MNTDNALLPLPGKIASRRQRRSTLEYSRRRLRCHAPHKPVQTSKHERNNHEGVVRMKKILLPVLSLALASTTTFGQNVRLTNDNAVGGYQSVYTLATGTAYTDPVLTECSTARGR